MDGQDGGRPPYGPPVPTGGRGRLGLLWRGDGRNMRRPYALRPVAAPTDAAAATGDRDNL